MSGDVRVYPSGQEPDVTVLVNGVWYSGELRMWRRASTGWVGQVRWHRAPGETLLWTFPEDVIREA